MEKSAIKLPNFLCECVGPRYCRLRSLEDLPVLLEYKHSFGQKGEEGSSSFLMEFADRATMAVFRGQNQNKPQRMLVRCLICLWWCQAEGECRSMQMVVTRSRDLLIRESRVASPSRVFILAQRQHLDLLHERICFAVW